MGTINDIHNNLIMPNPNSEWFAKSGLYQPQKPKNKAQQLLELSELVKVDNIKELKDEFDNRSKAAAIGQRRYISMSVDKYSSSIVNDFIIWLNEEGFQVTYSDWRNERSLSITW